MKVREENMKNKSCKFTFQNKNLILIYPISPSF